MARPRYIIGSTDRIIDRATGAISHINVVDRFVFHPLPKDGASDETIAVPLLPLAKLIITASWIRDSSDSDKDLYEYEMRLIRPDGQTRDVTKGEFTFTKRYFRIDGGLQFTTHSDPASGEVVIECRIRRVEGGEWISQSFSFDVEILDPSVSFTETQSSENMSR